MQSCQLHERSSSLSKALPHYFYLTDSITFRFVTNYTSATRSSSNAHSQPHQHKAHLYKCFLSMRPNHTTNTFAASSSLGSSIPPTFQSSLMSYRRYIIYRLTSRTYFSSLLFRPSSKSVRIVRIRRQWDSNPHELLLNRVKVYYVQPISSYRYIHCLYN